MKLREIEEGISKCTSNDKAEAMQLYQECLHGSGRKAGYHSPVHSAAMLLHPPIGIKISQKCMVRNSMLKKEVILSLYLRLYARVNMMQ